MKFFKKSFISIFVILCLISLTGCMNFSLSNSGKNYLKVYDSNGKVIKNIEGQDGLSIYSKVDTNYKNVTKEAVPRDAKVSYKYVSHARSHNIKITVTVYSNYKIAKITGIPVIGGGIIHLNDKEYNKLNNPDKLVNDNS